MREAGGRGVGAASIDRPTGLTRAPPQVRALEARVEELEAGHVEATESVEALQEALTEELNALGRAESDAAALRGSATLACARLPELDRALGDFGAAALESLRSGAARLDALGPQVQDLRSALARRAEALAAQRAESGRHARAAAAAEAAAAALEAQLAQQEAERREIEALAEETLREAEEDSARYKLQARKAKQQLKEARDREAEQRETIARLERRVDQMYKFGGAKWKVSDDVLGHAGRGRGLTPQKRLRWTRSPRRRRATGRRSRTSSPRMRACWA